MNCNKCGTENAPGSAFCVGCGEDLRQADNLRCRNCGNELLPGDRFCQACGTPAGAAPRRKSDNTGLKILIIILFIILAVMVAVIAGRSVYEQYTKSDVETDWITTRETIEPVKSTEPEKTEAPVKETEAVSAIKTEEPTEEPEQEFEGGGNGFMFDSHRYYITSADLRGKTKQEVAMMRNEIFARHGYIFKSEPYKSYFESKSWYRPNPGFSESDFNDIEKSNKSFIVEYEKSMGWR